jgi:polar amino acid transport system substrate-binding protein
MRLALALICLVLAGPVLAKDTLSLCFERKDVPPWRTIDGAGLNFDLLGQVAARLDIELKYDSLPWKRCLAKLTANEVDGAFSVSFSRSRVSMGAFPGGEQPDASKRLHTANYSLVRRKGSKINWDGKQFSGVDGLVGFQLGYSVGEFLRDQKLKVDELNVRAGELARQVVAGKLAAAAIFDTDVAQVMSGPLAPQLEVLPVKLIEKPYFLMLSRKLATGNPALAQRLWKTIEEVRISPGYQKLEHEHADAMRK